MSEHNQKCSSQEWRARWLQWRNFFTVGREGRADTSSEFNKTVRDIGGGLNGIVQGRVGAGWLQNCSDYM